MSANKQTIIQLREQGLSYREIAEIVGVSKQRCAQVCAKYSPWHFKKITEEQCVYPNWRKWMNENRITKTELLRRMGFAQEGTRTQQLMRDYMAGTSYPRKQTIDKILEVTGLTYEQLFYKDGD